MKLFFVALVAAAALLGPAVGNRVTSTVYPCPHSGTTRLAHTSSCSRFVQCVNGAAVEEQCADGLLFDEAQQRCTTPALANCTVEQNPCPRWTDAEQLVFLTNGNNCSNYFMCFDGQPLTMQCASGLRFNRDTNQCDSSLCATTHWSCSREENRRHSDDSDCARFYHCQNGVQYGGSCPEGLLFDSVTLRCVNPRYASCGVFTTVPVTTVTPRPTVSCEPTCTTPTSPTTNTTIPVTTQETTKKTTTQKPTTTKKTTTTTTKKTTTTTTEKPKTTTTKKTTTTTTEKPKTTTTKKTTTTTTEKPKTTTTPKPPSTTTKKTTTAKTTTEAPTTTTTQKPELNLDLYCKVDKVGKVALVAHPERCDWYISCVLGHGTVGKCGSYQIFKPSRGRCVLGNPDTCQIYDEAGDEVDMDGWNEVDHQADHQDWNKAVNDVQN